MESRPLRAVGFGLPAAALVLGACLGLVACQQDEVPERPFVDGIGGAPDGGYAPNPGGGKTPGGSGAAGGTDGTGGSGGAGGAGGEGGMGGAGGLGGSEAPGAGGAGGGHEACGLGEIGLSGPCSACVTEDPFCCDVIGDCLEAMECAPFFACATACEDATCMLTCLSMHPLAAQLGGNIVTCLSNLCAEACNL